MPSAHLLGRPVSSPCMHAGVLVGPGRERRGIPRGQRREPPDPWNGRRARMLGWSVPLRAVGQELDEAEEKSPPLAPRTSEGSTCGCWTPPLTWTLPSRTLPLLHKPHSMKRAPYPSFILDTSSPFGHFILLFVFNKSLSEAWCHTHCVCRLLFPPHYIEGMWLR